MWLFVIATAIFLGVVLVSWTILSERHGVRSASIAVVLVALFSIAVTGITILVLKYNLEKIEPVVREDWQQVNTLNSGITGFFYEPGIGLFAKTSDDEIKITDRLPICSRDSYWMRFTENARQKAEITTNPRDTFPPPSPLPVQEIDFSIAFPGAYGVVKYAGYDDGIILCKEGIIVNGLNPNAKIYILTVLGMFFAFIVFVISLLGTTGVAFFILQRRKNLANERDD